MRRRTHSSLLLVAVAIGCGDDGSATDAIADAPLDSTADVVMADPTVDPPAAPALPVLTPCPTGWTEIEVAGVGACEPWPLDEGPGCETGQVRFVGESCGALGPACPSDGVPTDLPPGPVLHVRAGSTAGDGSLTAPFATIGEAIATAAPGDVIAIHSGTYPEAIDISGTGVHVVGACVAETVIDAPDGPVSSAAVLMSGDTSLSRVTIRGGRPGVRTENAGAARIEDVWVEASYLGLVVTNMGALIAESVVVRDIAPGTSYGYGVFVHRAGSIEIRRGDFSNLHGAGLALSDDGSSALVEDAAFREVAPAPDSSVGTSVVSQNAVDLTVRRTLVEHGIATGFLTQLGAVARLEDVLVRDIEADDSDSGFGLAAVSEGVMNASRVRVVESTAVGVIASGYRTSVTAVDVVTHEIRPGAGEGGGGVGFFFDTGTTATVERLLVHHSAGAAISLVGTDLDVSIRDATCVDILVDGDLGFSGLGVDLRLGAVASLERAHVEGAIAAGVVISGEGSSLTATDLTVRSTQPTPTGKFGRGASIQLGAELACTRCVFHESVEAGVLLDDARATLSHLVVEGTAASDTSGAGMGVVSVSGSTGEIDGFAILRNAVAGVQIATGGDLLIRNGVIAENPVGVNVQDAPPNQAALSDGVIYRDNGRNLDSSGLPVPEATPF